MGVPPEVNCEVSELFLLLSRPNRVGGAKSSDARDTDFRSACGDGIISVSVMECRGLCRGL